MMCPHCGKSVTPRTPMTPSQREVYAAMLRLQERGERLTLAKVAREWGHTHQSARRHVEALMVRGWLECGAPGRTPMSGWTFTRPLDPDAVYLAHRDEAA